MRQRRATWILLAIGFSIGWFALPAWAADTVAAHTPLAQDQPAQPAASPAGPRGDPPTAEPAPAVIGGGGVPHQPLTGQTAAMAAGATYVGSETCTTCHGEVEDSLKHTPHGSPE